jgi:hypothetical protein
MTLLKKLTQRCKGRQATREKFVLIRDSTEKTHAEAQRCKATREKFVLIREIRGFFQ